MKSKPRICAAIAGRTVDDALALAEAARISGADLVELRADYLESTTGLEGLAQHIDMPKILTLRRREEGGAFKGGERSRIELLLELAEYDFAYVDVELSTRNLQDLVRKIKLIDREVIVSFHDLSFTPSFERLHRIVEKEVEAGADICKVVTTAQRVSDCMTCLMLTLNGLKRGIKTISFAMGRLGIPSRVLAPIFGAPFTYAAVFKRRETAPGQLTVLELKRIYRELEIS